MQYPRGGYALPGTTQGFKTGSWRVQRPTHHHFTAPCHHACPAGEDAQAWLALLEEGDQYGAWRQVVRANPLPACTGRVCLHPCESACNRAQLDEPIAIHGVERFLGDMAIQKDWDYGIVKPAADAARIAVVGAGPAGLSNAIRMLEAGFNVTLFDAFPSAGGTLRTGIPNYRLPDQVLDAELERILALGLEWRPHSPLGRAMSLEELEQDFAAIFLAPGAMQGRDWSVGDVTPQDLHQGLDLIREWMTVGKVPECRSAAVVGGGNTAIDVARILRRCGVPEVHIITHNGLPGPDAVPGDVMRAIPLEIEHAQEEGVQIHAHRGIRRLILRGSQVIGVEMVHMKKMPDANGRLQRIAFEGTETVLHVDQVIPAVGQVVQSEGLERVLQDRHWLPVNEGYRVAGHDRVWAGGDGCSRGQGTVAGAVGDGRKAALEMIAQLRGQPPLAPDQPRVIGHELLNAQYFGRAERAREPVLEVSQRIDGAEVVGAITPRQALDEAARCLSCGNCMSCDNCYTFCPDSAVLKDSTARSGAERYVFDYDYCKGCGLCANECPVGYIEMIEEQP